MNRILDLLPADQFDLDGPTHGKALAWIGDMDPKGVAALMGRSSPHPELGLLWKKGYDTVVEKDTADNGRLQFSISSDSEDRAGDVIEQDGWKFDNYENNPIVLFDHEYGEVAGSPPSQGKTLAIGTRKNDLRATVEFHRQTKFNEELYQMYRGGYMRAASVGFWPLEQPEERETERGLKGFRFTKQELLEWSLVAVPMNADAYSLAAKKGIIRPRTSEYLIALGAQLGTSESMEDHRKTIDEQSMGLAMRQLTGATARLSMIKRRVKQ